MEHFPRIKSKYLFNLLFLFSESGNNLALSGYRIYLPNLNDIYDCYKFKYKQENRLLVGLYNHPTRLNLRYNLWFITISETKEE